MYTSRLVLVLIDTVFSLIEIALALFLFSDVMIHFLRIPPVIDSFMQLGYPLTLALPIAYIELVCLALYIFPKTSVIGAILLTGYLGGAVASNLRAGLPLFSHVLFPVY